MKNALKFHECAIMLNFAKTYSFLVQDAVQGFHWHKSQATLHPCVIYFKDLAIDALNNMSLVCISDDNEHNHCCLCNMDDFATSQGKQLFEFCENEITNIPSFYISRIDVNKNKSFLQQRYNRVKPIPGTQSHHSFVPLKNGK